MFSRSRYLLRRLSAPAPFWRHCWQPVAFAAGPKAYVGNFKDNTVSVIDTDAGAVVATIPVVAGPHGMAVSPDGRNVYVSGDLASTVSVIDTASDRVAQTIEVGKAPHGLAMKSDGKLLLVAVYGDDRVAFVDTSTRAVIGTVMVAKPHNIAIPPDDKVAYIGSQEPGHFALVVVDLVTRAVVRSVRLDKSPRGLEFGNDGKALYYTLGGCQRYPGSRLGVGQSRRGNSNRRIAAYRRLLSRRDRRSARRPGTRRIAIVQPGNQRRGAQRGGGQTAALGCHRRRRQKGLRDQRGFERFHRRRPRNRSDDDDCGGQRAAQGRRPGRRGECREGNVG